MPSDVWTPTTEWTGTDTKSAWEEIYESEAWVAVITPEGCITKLMTAKEFAIDTIKLQPFF